MIDLFLPLMLILLFILIVTLIYFKFDFIEPSIIVVSMMFISTTLALFTAEQWNLSLGIKTIFWIISSIIVFILGGYFANICFKGRQLKVINSDFYYNIDNMYILITITIMILMLYFNFQAIYELSIKLGNENGYANMIKIIRPYVELNEVSFSRWINYRFQIAQALAYIYLYAFIYNAVYAKKYIFRFLLPVVCYVPFLMLSTGRVSMFYLIIYIVVALLILYQKRQNYSFISKINSVKYLIISGICFITIFFIMGLLTGKTFVGSYTPLMVISHYAGISIPALDVLMNRGWIETPYIGSHTLLGVYRILQKIIENMPSVPNFLPFVFFYGVDTNAYTAQGRYIMDYGYIGMLAIMWILGAGYSLFYNMAKYSDNALLVILYAHFCYPVFMISIEERFCLDLIGTSSIYAIVLMFLSSKFLLKHKKNG